MTDNFKESDVKRDREGKFAKVASLPTFGRPGGPKRNHAPGTKAGIAEFRRMAKAKIQKRDKPDPVQKAADDLDKSNDPWGNVTASDPLHSKKLQSVIKAARYDMEKVGIRPPVDGDKPQDKSPDVESMAAGDDQMGSVKGRKRAAYFSGSKLGLRNKIVMNTDRPSTTQVGTYIHEFGHYFDYRHGALGSYGSVLEDSDSMAEFFHHMNVHDKSVQRLWIQSEKGDSFAEYLIDPKEIWARAFQQFCGHPNRTESWTNEYFDREIRPLVKNVLKEAGWLSD